MGQPKLLLPLAGVSIIERLLRALDHPCIATRHVVVRQGDAALQAEVSRLDASLVIPPNDPPDMRASVEIAVARIQQEFSPGDEEGWLLVPADHPVLDRGLIEVMMKCWATVHPKILVPRSGHRRGHPTMFRWSLAHEVAQIPPDCGLNWLVREHAAEVTEIPVDSDAAISDLDTPEDYARLRTKWEG